MVSFSHAARIFTSVHQEFADSFAWSALLVGRPPLLQPWPTQTSRAGYGSRALQTKKNHTYDPDPSRRHRDIPKKRNPHTREIRSSSTISEESLLSKIAARLVARGVGQVVTQIRVVLLLIIFLARKSRLNEVTQCTGATHRHEIRVRSDAESKAQKYAPF